MGAITGLGLSPAVLGSADAQPASNTRNTSGVSTPDKTEFLNLLVAQLKNQDPLNPMDNTEFVTQLAAFSSLEQLMSINQAVTKLAEETAGTTSTAFGNSRI